MFSESENSGNTSIANNLPDTNSANSNPPVDSSDSGSLKPNRPKRLIGSQRNPEAYRPQPTIKVVDDIPATSTNSTTATSAVPNESDNEDDNVVDSYHVDLDKKIQSELMISPDKRIEIPKIRDGKMSDDLEAEFAAVMGAGGISNDLKSIDNLLQSASEVADREVIEAGTKLQAKVIAIRGDSLFLDLNAREQGVVLINMFAADATPKLGDEIEVTVGKFDADEGLYEVTVPLAAAEVRDWSQVQVGMVVEAKVTKSNSGGLECEVNRLRGFIPISHIDIFRVDDLERYVGQSLTCVVEEVNLERRNLVVSRRSMINREREELRKQLLTELSAGQVREGLVRKIIDGGVFVDLGGVDGFIPISKLSWGRVRHPSDVLSEGKRIKVRIDKIEEGTNRISLTYRDDSSNPWSNIFEHFQEKTQVRGKVVNITAFGAFIELMPGVDGLVLINEISNKRINNVNEILKISEIVDVFIVSINVETKQIKLSMKQLIPSEEELPDDSGVGIGVDAGVGAESNKTDLKSADSKTQNIKRKQEGVAIPIKIKNIRKGPLKGGIGNNDGESNGGLKW
ncbi:MAG: S1 RNA-binding domain-containing protein [Planctomycetaceae bacterium]|jgi:small subunit ribosomal protein S1|nr:S1 RNA-binding domain-containing protein [Planctomycetaceae bacterium]